MTDNELIPSLELSCTFGIHMAEIDGEGDFDMDRVDSSLPGGLDVSPVRGLLSQYARLDCC